MRRSAHVVAALAFWLPLAVSGQRAPSLGDQVRLRSPNDAWPVGVVTSVTPDSIEVRQRRGRPEVGSPDRRILGAVIGGVHGLVVGAFLGYSTFDENAVRAPCMVYCSSGPMPTQWETTYATGVIGALLGAGLGMIIGSRIKVANTVEVTRITTHGVAVRVQVGHGRRSPHKR